ncbi:MAG: hypothetical protein ACNS62_15915 [Candidatus Cyclobacteriaceae bacterium M3_2C_046]
MKQITILVLLSISWWSCQTDDSDKKYNEVILTAVDLIQEPVITAGDPGTEDNQFGFEGGTCRKVGDTYYIFTTEVFDQPKTAAVRMALWTSGNGIDFQKKSVIASTNYNWEDTTHRMSPWSPMAVYDQERELWSVFHVGYRRKANSTNVFNMSGRIFRYDSEVKGREGIGGPYQEGDWVTILGEPDWWEGPGEIVSFYPYKAGDEWWAFYGGNSVPDHIDASGQEQEVKHIFYAGLAQSKDGLTDEWERQYDLNPVQMDPEFIENSVVTKINDHLYINLYDGANEHAISYSWSPDGINWQPEQLIEFPDPPGWIKSTRTPLGLIDEGNGIYSIYFTAFDGNNPEKIEPTWHDGFGHVGLLKVKLEIQATGSESE